MRIIFSVLCICLACTLSAQTKKYYRNAYLNALGNCIGMYPISEDEAASMNYYVFEYDTINRLYDVKSCKMDESIGVYSEVLKGIRLTYSYEEDYTIVQSYNAGDDLDNIYEPNGFYWQLFYDKNKKVNSITTMEVSEMDEEYFEESSRVEYVYNENGEITSFNARGLNAFYFGELLSPKTGKIRLNNNFQIIEENYVLNVDEDTSLLTPFRILNVYSEEGAVLSIKKYNRLLNLIPIDANIAFYEFDFDSLGYVKSKIAFDDKGLKSNYKLYSDQNNLLLEFPSIVNFENDSIGNIITVSHFNQDSLPYLLDGKVYKVEFKYDTLNNLLSQRNLGLNSEMALDKDGFALYQYKYEGIDKLVEKSFYGLDSLPVKNLSGVHKIKYEYDEYDFITAELFYDENNQLTADYSDANRYEYEYNFDADGFGQTIVEAFDLNNNYLGNDVLNDEFQTQAKIRTLADLESGLVYSISWFDTLSRPINNEFGYHQVKNKYQKEYLTEEVYLDSLQNLFFVSSLGYAKREIKLNDTLEVESEIRYYNANNQLVKDVNGVAIYKYEYDSLKQVIQEDRFDEKEMPITLLNGYYRSTKKYDINGNLLEVAFFDNSLKLYEDSFGFATYRFKYNTYLLEEKSFYGKKKKLKADAKGVAIYLYKYDENGNLLEERYHNHRNKPCENSDSVFIMTMTYTKSNLLHTVEARNKKGQLVETNLIGVKAARLEYFYDEISQEDGDVRIKIFNKKNEEIQEIIETSTGDPEY